MTTTYEIKLTEQGTIVFATSYANPFVEWGSMEGYFKKTGYKGFFFVDLLLCNGFSDNRVFKGLFDGERIDRASFEKIPPDKVDPKLLYSMELYHKEHLDQIQRCLIIDDKTKASFISNLVLKHIGAIPPQSP